MNASRRRWYGLRVGDCVVFMGHLATVVELNALDNNACFLRDDGSDKVYPAVCEWCRIITKVEELHESSSRNP